MDVRECSDSLKNFSSIAWISCSWKLMPTWGRALWWTSGVSVGRILAWRNPDSSPNPIESCYFLVKANSLGSDESVRIQVSDPYCSMEIIRLFSRGLERTVIFTLVRTKKMSVSLNPGRFGLNKLVPCRFWPSKRSKGRRTSIFSPKKWAGLQKRLSEGIR